MTSLNCRRSRDRYACGASRQFLSPTQTALFQGAPIHFGEEMSLTELFKASGRPRSMNPTAWKQYKSADLIRKVQSDAGPARIVFRTSKGGANKVAGSGAGGGGTFAHWQIAFEYAHYLNPDLAKVCNKVGQAGEHRFLHGVAKSSGELSTEQRSGPSVQLP